MPAVISRAEVKPSTTTTAVAHHVAAHLPPLPAAALWTR
jgi:hypothetical protein